MANEMGQILVGVGDNAAKEGEGAMEGEAHHQSSYKPQETQRSKMTSSR